MIAKPDTESDMQQKLSKRDWILLPLISLATIIFLAASTEMLGWWLFPWSGVHTLVHDCVVGDDPTTGMRGIPNTVCWDKIAETRPVQYKFNSCGHRAGMECGPKSPGTYRIVMVGSSIAMGYRVAQEQTIASYLPVELTRQTGRKVELYNESFAFGSPHTIDLKFNKVLDAQPDLILWVLTPRDLTTPNEVFTAQFAWKLATNTPQSGSKPRGFFANAWINVKTRFVSQSFSSALRAQWEQTRTSFMLRHYLYLNQQQYVKAYFAETDEEKGFLNVQPSAAWRDRIKQFDGVATAIESHAEQAGVPLVAVLYPNRAQAAMISMGQWPRQYDPYKLNNELRSIITSHGESYIDILPDFRTVPNPEKYYLPMDGHPTGEGNAVVSAFLAKELTDGVIPALQAANQSQASTERPK